MSHKKKQTFFEGEILTPVDKWLIKPLNEFIQNSTTSGIVLFGSALIAMVLANSAWADGYHSFWKHRFVIGFDQFVIDKDLHHWINDGLMAVFFFVVGLELKREIVAGALSKPKDAILPLIAAVGGMIFPACIYLLFNPTGEESNGWGIPMATDIAFALGVLYLLGNRVPAAVKIFITALAIADDLGAVLVIAFFYTSNINTESLVFATGFLMILVASNLLGVRNTLYYGIIGIGGLWVAFLLSGVHATIAAVLAAFTIPASVKLDENNFSLHLSKLIARFDSEKPNNLPTVSDNQFQILEEIKDLSLKALTPLQRLENGMHPFVAFIVMPIFAFSNAGISIDLEISSILTHPVTLGVMLGLLLGKVVGVAFISWLVIRLKLASLPEGMKLAHLPGIGFLASIGFTMSLFISGLAFNSDDLVNTAKLGILIASVLASLLGYYLIRKAC
ncbi:MAG: Na+/H+ antiporter NhaA [Saprospiraceae bacterium]|nr:Na+/H+ antiporter NhaA [Saprospiraceae bacterium]